MKKILYRFLPFIVCLVIFFCPFSVSAASFTSSYFDFVSNAVEIKYSDGTGFVNVDSMSVDGSSTPLSVTFRVYFDTSNRYERFTIGFYSSIGVRNVEIGNVQKFAPVNFNHSRTDDWWNYYSATFEASVNSMPYQILSDGYIDLTIYFSYPGSQPFRLSINEFIGFSSEFVPLDGPFSSIENDLYFENVNGEILPQINTSYFDLYLGSLVMNNKTDVLGASTVTYYFDVGIAKLPFLAVGDLLFNWVSTGDSSCSIFVYEPGKLLYQLPVVVEEGREILAAPGVSTSYGNWAYTGQADISAVQFDKGQFLRIQIEIDYVEYNNSFHSSFRLTDVLISPYSAEPNFFVAFWNRIKSGFDSVVSAIGNIFSDDGSGSEFLEEAQSSKQELEGAQAVVDSVARPDLENSGDISHIVDNNAILAYGGVFSGFLQNDFIIQILVLLSTFMLAGFVLFGKK